MVPTIVIEVKTLSREIAPRCGRGGEGDLAHDPKKWQKSMQGVGGGAAIALKSNK